MMEDDFYATIKLKTGEEIFARVSPVDENDKILLLVTSPIIISEITNRSGASGYKVEPWLKTTTEDMFIVKMDDVLTMSESKDIEMIMMHQSFVRKFGDVKDNRTHVSREMGYIANVNDAKDLLEKLFKNS
jgi:hypothetical protein